MEREFSLFETSFPQLAEVALTAVLAYFAIILIVRVNGSRTTAELNSFDWIINVMIGSLAASGVVLEAVSLLDALLAIVVLTGLQFALTWLTQRYEVANNIVKAQPVLLSHKGEYLEDAMRETRVSEDEIMTVLRENGMTSLADANWVILETNGQLSVIPANAAQSVDAVDTLRRVKKPDLE